jgi:hypothetical protein
MAASVLYYPDFIHVAFIAPFALVVAAALVHDARSGLARLGRFGRLCGQAVLAAGFVAVISKGWGNVQAARQASPERYATAFGTLAGSTDRRQMVEKLREVMSVGPQQSATFFSYPNDASLYLTIPGENPTPFSLVMPGYNTPEQYRTVIDALERTRTRWVVINIGAIRSVDDPVMRYLTSRYAVIARVGRRGLYHAFARVGPG